MYPKLCVLYLPWYIPNYVFSICQNISQTVCALFLQHMLWNRCPLFATIDSKLCVLYLPQYIQKCVSSISSTYVVKYMSSICHNRSVSSTCCNISQTVWLIFNPTYLNVCTLFAAIDPKLCVFYLIATIYPKMCMSYLPLHILWNICPLLATMYLKLCVLYLPQ